LVNPAMCGHLKQALVQIGYPAEDLAGYVTGEYLTFAVRPTTGSSAPFGLRQ
jgi:DNA excision repair protein ERCC-3